MAEKEASSAAVPPDFALYRPQLLQLAARHLPPLLHRVTEPEDVVQETLKQACEKPEFFVTRTEVPPYCKLRTLLLHVLADTERRYLKAQKRRIGNEVSADDSALQPWVQFADTLAGPLSHLARQERHSCLRQAVAALSENDRTIIELSCFDGMSYADCAAVLGITPKAAGLRYLKALQRLREELSRYSLFRP